MEYDGLQDDDTIHNHGEMEAGLKGFLDGVRKSKHPSDKWNKAFNAILDTYLGTAPETFDYEGKSYSPKSFAEKLGLNGDDFVNLTSFNI